MIVRLIYVCGYTASGTLGDGHMVRRDGDPETAPRVIRCPHCDRPAAPVRDVRPPTLPETPE